ncbi:MAG TPA: PDZ domain-containing protein [Saprospiraceae bacterium]|nr:PDZ domain-containing protein [Saprospiraceae bacterium]HMP24232.1 PDZ domain-containing protein [Saprospiraceae bacterium]
MHHFTRLKTGAVFVLCLLCSALLLAQQQPSQLTIVKKITQADGTTIIEQHELPSGADWLRELQTLRANAGENVEWHLTDQPQSLATFDSENGETLAFVRMAENGQGPEAQPNQQHIVWQNNQNHPPQNMAGFATVRRDPCRVFIGVSTTQHGAEGLRVHQVIQDTPAAEYGVQVGDLILAMDNVKVSTQKGLEGLRDQHQPGEAFTLTVLRNDQEVTLSARFKECTPEALEAARLAKEAQAAQQTAMRARLAAQPKNSWASQERQVARQERPVLGIYPDEEYLGEGITISNVKRYAGAAAAGLQAGDRITTIDGQSVTGTASIRAALSEHKPGDKVMVAYQRDGQTRYAEVTLSGSVEYVHQTVKRDPCAVFIGIYSSSRGTQPGVRVSGVIAGTPAKASGIQPGDVIIALDDVPVNNHQEVVRERDKHQPGDPFTLLVLRDDNYIEIDAVFNSCTTTDETPATIEEVVEMAMDDEAPAELPALELKSELAVELFQIYPNPTVGLLNVQFSAEAVPTIVRILDATGKEVYQEALNSFNGFYNQQIDLKGNAPGIYVLTIQQGTQRLTKKIALLPKV